MLLCQFFKYVQLFQQSIGLWIDLTNTKRYYSRFEVEDMGRAYVKMPCVGHGNFPTCDVVELFLNICYNFLGNNFLQFIGSLLSIDLIYIIINNYIVCN